MINSKHKITEYFQFYEEIYYFYLLAHAYQSEDYYTSDINITSIPLPQIKNIDTRDVKLRVLYQPSPFSTTIFFFISKKNIIIYLFSMFYSLSAKALPAASHMKNCNKLRVECYLCQGYRIDRVYLGGALLILFMNQVIYQLYCMKNCWGTTIIYMSCISGLKCLRLEQDRKQCKRGSRET